MDKKAGCWKLRMLAGSLNIGHNIKILKIKNVGYILEHKT